MANASTPRPLDRLVPAVAEYATDWFRLADDLDRLDRVHRAEAPEAAVLYCARVLEALAADALAAVNLQPSPNLFSNLDTLQSLNLIPTATGSWAHALRRMGNLVRHIRCRIALEDADFGAHFLERWLDWFFREFRYGRRVASLTHDGEPLGLSRDVELHGLMQSLESEHADLAAAARHLDLRLSGSSSATPTLPAILVELLLDRGDHPEAGALLGAALARFPADLRLRQLQGLLFSRTGRLSEAQAWLESLYEQHGDDDETAGIIAGAYKRGWFADRARRDWLEFSNRAYRQGWKKSKQSNGYLGINAATTSLWLGRADDSRKTAAAVYELLLSQTAALATFSRDQDLAFGFWQHLTLVEADLLLGRLSEAQVRFRRTVERYHDRQSSNIEVARQQFAAILATLGHSPTAMDCLGPNSSPDVGRAI